MCPSCWQLRESNLEPNATYSETRLQTAALVLGSVAILPIPALQLGALIVGIIALWKARAGAALEVRWKPALGLAFCGVGILVDIVLVTYLVAR